MSCSDYRSMDIIEQEAFYQALHPSGGNAAPVGASVVRSGGVGLYGRSLGDCVARPFPLMDVDPLSTKERFNE